MFFKVKKHSFLLLEILLALALFSMLLSAVYRPFRAQKSLLTNWEEETHWQNNLDFFYSKLKADLKSPQTQKKYLQTPYPKKIPSQNWQLGSKKYECTFTLSCLDQKPEAYLIKIEVHASEQSSKKTKHSFEIFCLKKS